MGPTGAARPWPDAELAAAPAVADGKRDKVLPAKAGTPASPFGTTLASIIGQQKLT